MEVGYKNIFVKKYSRGNSFAIENDVENKRYKIKFINKYSLGILFTVLLILFTMALVFLIYSFKPIQNEFRTLKYQKRIKNTVLFHKDEYIRCKTRSCKEDVEYISEYFERLKEGLRLEGYDYIETKDVESSLRIYDKITKTELESISEYLVRMHIVLDEKFEIPTIIKFKKYIKEFKREYKDKDEYKKKYKNFRFNRIFIETHNSDPGKLYTMGYTQAADTNEEDLDLPILDQSSLKYMIDDDITQATIEKVDKFNESGIIFDWRKKGHVNEIRDQGKCGTCWAFASADLISSMVSIKTNVLKTYSTQQLADCILPFYGCQSGGNPIIALDYIKRYNYCTEQEYPYKMSDYACIQPNECKDKIPIKSILTLKNSNLEDYIETKGPFVFIIFVSKEFMFYKEGIFDGECGKLSNHAVLVVGHGHDKERNVSYWIVKNSWTKDWGEDGYFRLINAHEIRKGRKSYYCKMDARAFGIKLK